MSKATTSGSTQTWGGGQEKNKYNVLFDQNSTSFISHDIQVDNDFFRVLAFNLATGESVTIEQVTGIGATFVSDYAPIDAPITLTPQRTSYVIERPGRYRFRLNAALGHVLVVGFQYAMENEATQDIIDSIINLANQFPLPLTVCETTTVRPDITGNILRENVKISQDANNCLTIHADGLYNPCPTSFTPTPCNIGNVIPSGATQNNVIGKDTNGCLVDFPLPTPNACSLGGVIPAGPVVNEVVGKSGGCLDTFPLVSTDAGNIITLRTNGVYAGASGAPDRCATGRLAVQGVPAHFLGIDANGCLVWFDIQAGPGITFVYNNTTNTYTITNQCYPCGSTTTINTNLCATAVPQNISSNCSDPPGSETYNETTIFNLSPPSGGTGPYTYDWTNAVGFTATWSPALGGTPTLVVTPSGSQLTIAATLSGANAAVGNSFVLNIPTTAYVTITDSATPTPNTTRRYLGHLTSTIGGNVCSIDSTVPTTVYQFGATITCTTPCTPETADFVQTRVFDTTGYTPAAGNNSITGAFQMNNNTASVLCGGTITFDPNLSITITDPLNTMGQGTTYTVPSSDIHNTLTYNVLDPGGSSGSDWPAAIVNTGSNLAPNMNWPVTILPASLGHGPADGTGDNMTLNAGLGWNIPSALFSDGAHHVMTIHVAGPSISAILGYNNQFNNPVPCCGGSANSTESGVVLTASWG